MTTETKTLTYDHIVALALEHGFKLKPQVDGRMALNDYVIDFARAVYDIGHAAAKAEHADVGEPVAWMAVVTHPRSQGPQAHFVSDAKLARQWDYNGVVDGEPCIVQPLFTGKPEKPRPSGRGGIGRHAKRAMVDFRTQHS